MSNLSPNQILEQYVTADQPVVIGLSGGPDSTFLMYTLQHFRRQKKYSDSNLVVCVLDHAMRSQSRDELETLRQQYAHYPFESVVYRGDDKSEAALRERRHSQFVHVCHKYQAKILLLGHNLTERVETFLLNTRRGTSVSGMTTMSVYQPHRQDQHIHILRPLIHTSKQVIMNELSSLALSYFIDQTNSDVSVSRRNKVRNDILPRLLSDDSHETKFLESMDKLFHFLEQKLDDPQDNPQAMLVDYQVPHQRQAQWRKERKIDRSQITSSQIMSLLTVLSATKGVSKASLEELQKFFRNSRSGHKYRNDMYFFVSHDRIHIVNAPKEFWIFDQDDDAHIITEADVESGCVNWKGNKLALPPGTQVAMILRYGCNTDQVKSKKRNKYCINRKIPFFIRNLVPVLAKAGKIQYVWNI